MKLQNNHKKTAARSTRWLLLAALSALMMLLGACGTEQTSSDKFKVYATTGYLADAIANIAPDAEITTMVGPGGDPHTYQPTSQDVEKLRASDMVAWNGLHLEAQMLDVLESFENRQIAVGEFLPKEQLLDWPETDDAGNALNDPHVWNSPRLWIQVVNLLTDKLSELDSDNSATYRKNADAYIAEIEKADKEVTALLGKVPADSRTLITGHDAFGYFGSTYGFDVYATDFVSTTAALSPAELSELADLIVANKVPVIFQDNQANPQAITSLQEAVESRGWTVAVSGDELFADSLGADAGVNTYLGVFRHNAKAVADAFGVN